MSRGERVINLILFVIMIVFFIEAQKIPAGLMVESVRREVGADFWPKALLSMLLFLTLVLNIKNFFLKKNGESQPKSEKQEKERWLNWILLSISIVVYIEIQYVIGFLFASILMVCFNLVNFGYRKKFFLIAIPIGLTFLFAFVFGRFLNVPLPKGVGIFREISFIIY